jgi:sugar-specific transcriptional regulator TrmB/DNA-binding CsgD family transcriptional regulator
MLDRLGVPPDDDRVYLALLRCPRLTRTGLAERAGLGYRTVSRAVDRLVELGVVTRLAGRPSSFVAVAPDAAVEIIIGKRQEEAALARADARLLLESPSAQQAGNGVEVAAGAAAVAAHIRRALDAAQDEVLLLDSADTRCALRALGDSAHRDVGRRRICTPETLDGQELPRAPERIRIRERLPTGLLIVDRAVAMLPFPPGEPFAPGSALVVRSTTLLPLLIQLFELLWQASVPVARRNESREAAGELDDRLLVLLAAGLKDEAIAGQLGVSLRTVHRRVSDLLELLGVRTRFQAGVQAVRLGMLADQAIGP